MNFQQQLQKEFERFDFTISQQKIHIRVQQRNGKKSITTIEGLAEDLDLKRICKDMRQKFNCNGNVIEDKDRGEVIQLQGDQRDNVKQWILTEQIISKAEQDLIVMHGF
jgi:translation initiation factor 1